MHLTERMLAPPATCMNCGCGNTPDGDTGEIGPFVDMERNVNWGDSAYLCVKCATIVGGLVGMITDQDKADLEAQLRRGKREIHDLKSEMELRQRREMAMKRKVDAVELLTKAS